MPIETKLQTQHITYREEVTLDNDPVLSGEIDTHGCQSVQVFLHYVDATAAAATIVVQQGDLADGSDMADLARTPIVLPQAEPGNDNLWVVLEISPAQRYIRLELAGVATGETVDLIVVNQNCMKIGHGSDKTPTPDGVKAMHFVCTQPDNCP